MGLFATEPYRQPSAPGTAAAAAVGGLTWWKERKKVSAVVLCCALVAYQAAVNGCLHIGNHQVGVA